MSNIQKNISKRLFIIAGCNGAGKTTASYTILPDILNCREFVNADEIARGLSPFNPEVNAITAGKLMSQQIQKLLKENATFSIETTLASRSYLKLIKQAHTSGYFISLIYFWLKSPQMAESRVKQRVKEGGHNIPTETIYKRYWTGLQYLFDLYLPVVDQWMIFDNSQSSRIMVAEGGLSIPKQIFNKRIFNDVQSTFRSRN